MATETQTEAQPPKQTFHLINKPENAIHDACTGLTYLKPDLSYNAEYKIVYRNDLQEFSQSHVTTIGFAGGGHGRCTQYCSGDGAATTLSVLHTRLLTYSTIACRAYVRRFRGG